MNCEIINNTPYPVRLKTSTEEKVLGVKESALFWSASTFTVGVSVLTNSYSEKDKSAKKASAYAQGSTNCRENMILLPM